MSEEIEKLLTDAPEHLSLEARKWWCHVHEGWDLEEHHSMVLTSACEAFDRCNEAKAIIDEKGITYTDRFKQPKARPEVAVERDSRLQFVRLVRELGLDLEQPGDRDRDRIRDARKLGVGT